MGDRKRRGDAVGSPATGESPASGPAFRFSQGEPDEGVPQLVRRLAEETSQLAEQQLKLVEAEVRSAVDDLKQSAGAMAGAAILGIAGLGLLLMSLSFLLATALPLWLATFIIAVATMGGAAALFLRGRSKLQSTSLSAERTRRTLERAPRAISGETSKGTGQ